MILHVDMDAFYAAVEIRDQPRLRGRPVIVGGSPAGRGVVAAASYEARRYGVHSAMPASQALRLCPHAVVLPPRMEDYAEVSRQLRDIFQQFTPLVEPLSLDEAFLDATGSQSLFGPPVEIGRRIKRLIAQRLELTASVGVAPNKFLAKLASDLEKPDGFVTVDPQRVQQFLDPLPVGRLWGVGKSTGQLFDRLGVKTIADLRSLPQQTLERRFGKQGRRLWELACGMDRRRVTPDRQAKSISHETTFAADIADREVLQAWAVELSEQVARRLRRCALLGRTVMLKVRFSDFRTITRSITLPRATDVTAEIVSAADEMLSRRLPTGRGAVRLLGVGVSGLKQRGPTQLLLFDDEQHGRQSDLDEASDEIRSKFGSGSLRRASGLLHRARIQPPPGPREPEQ